MVLDSRKKMLEINVRQKDYYESRFEAGNAGKLTAERAANIPTNIWMRMLYKERDLRRVLGVDEFLYSLHREWMSELKGKCVLDLGCFKGNNLSLWMAENCAEYTGIDLSEQAIGILNTKLREHQLVHAHAYTQDFLANSFPDNHFDLIYAFSVLHHFKDISVLLKELNRVLKPGGTIISVDPLMTEPFNRIMRLLYRPLQTDREWEWPFNRRTFDLLQEYFEILDMQGFIGMVKLGFPFQMIPGLGGLGRSVGSWGLEFDKKHARRLNLPFFLCWQATLRLLKPDQK